MNDPIQRREFMKHDLAAGGGVALLSVMKPLHAGEKRESIESNETLKTLFSLRTIHGNFNEHNIPDDQISQIVKAGVQAANSSNMQTYSIIVVKDRDKMRQVTGYQGGCMLVFCADHHRIHASATHLGHSYHSDTIVDFITASMDALLAESDDIELVGEAQDGPDGVGLINKSRPDLAFLDIQLPVFTGFDVLRKINHRPLIIFITANDEYAIKAFEANAVDYLLKPTSKERLEEAIRRVRQRHPKFQDILSVMNDILEKRRFRDRFTVKIGDEVLLIPAADVLWFQAEDKYVFIHTTNQKYLIEETLKDLEACLDPELFIRIHKSVIINVKKINRIKRNPNGQYRIQLNDSRKSAFEIGRTFLPVVREKFKF